MAEHFDVLIVGAGISGIGAAYHLEERRPGTSYAILEAREDLGGTWDLFRYPGIRSDSDMHTLGYRFRPWTESKSIADGSSILRYVRETAREGGIDGKIRFQHRVVRADWSTPESRWTVEVERADTGETETLTCGFLWMCAGYYRYDEGYVPDFEGSERFAGTIVHPQHWTDDIDYEGKRVVVIGSGATAVTLVPTLAERAAHVTMLQRSPTYIVSMPAEDRIANRLRKVLPDRAAYAIVRWKNVLLQMASYQLSRRRPKAMKGLLRKAVERALPAGYDVDKHFSPRYDPWDQRLCLVPDGDLFKAIRGGRAEIVTDRIEAFTEGGIKLASGAELEADLIVTATGLNLLFLGGLRVAIDGCRRRPDRADDLQGDDAQRHPQPRLHARLHERLLDAEGRPHLRVRLPPARPHGGPRPEPVRPRADRPQRGGGGDHGPQLRLHPPLPRPAAQTGLQGAVEAAPELRLRHPHDPPRPDRRRRDAVLDPGDPRRAGGIPALSAATPRSRLGPRPRRLRRARSGSRPRP